MKTSEIIAKRIKDLKGRFYANDNIAKYIKNDELDNLQKEVEEACENLLKALVIDIDNDHNTKGTAKRLAKMYLKEIYSGRYAIKPNATEFPNVSNLDQVYTVGPIEIRSACSHHFLPVTGSAWIGIHPSTKVLGLSKFNRLVDWLASRPSIQEELTTQIADEIENTLKPLGVGVIIKAKHSCCSLRGVKDSGTVMTTSIVRGTLRDFSELKSEFFNLVKQV